MAPTRIQADRVPSPLGDIMVLACDGVMIGLEFDDQPDRIARDLTRRFGDYVLAETANPGGYSDRLRAYLAKDFAAFDGIATDGGGTPFQARVWTELKRIPCGETISYAALARRLGDPKATRAVGLANGRNPISIAVPCHRVIGADGSLTGYGGGIERKRWLLRHEGVPLGGKQGDLFGGGAKR